MSDPRLPNIYKCPHIETCIAPIEQEYFQTHCREYSATPKHPQYEQCNAYNDMSRLPRMWNRRVLKSIQDQGMSRARHRV